MTNKEKTAKHLNRQLERHIYKVKEQQLKLEEKNNTQKTITVNSQTIDYLQQLLLQIHSISESLFKPKKVLKSVQTQTDIQVCESIIKNTSDCSLEPIKINVNNKIKNNKYNCWKIQMPINKKKPSIKYFP